MNRILAFDLSTLRPPAPLIFFLIALSWYLAYIAHNNWGFGLLSPYPNSDAELYDHYAWYKAFIDSSGGALGKIIPPSAYVFFLELTYKVTGPRIITPFLYNAITLAIACAFMMQLSHNMFDRLTGYTAGILFMLCGPMLFYVGLSMKSTSVILFLCASLYFLHKCIIRPSARSYLLFSLSLGLLCVDRNNFLLALLFIPVLAFKKSYNKRSMANILLLLYLPAIGIISVFDSVQNHASPTSPVGINFYIGNSAKATGAYTNLDTIGNSLIGHHGGILRTEHAGSTKLSDRVNTQFDWIKKALGEHADNPTGLLKIELKKLLMLFARDVPGSPEQYALWRWHDSFLVIAFVDYGLILSLAIPGMFLLWRMPEHKNKRAHILIPIFYALFLIPFFIIERYRLPILVALIPFAAYTCRLLFTQSVTLKRRAVIASISTVFYVISIFLVAIVPYGPGWTKDPEGKREFEITSNKHRQEIYRMKRQAVMKNDPYAWNMLHRVYAVTELKDDAEEFSRRALGKKK